VEDVPAIVDLGRRFHAESHYRAVPYDDAWTRRTMTNYASGHPEAFLRVAYEGDTLIGFFAGRLGAVIFSPEKAAIQDLLYVAPEARNGRAGLRMLAQFLDWAAAHDPAFIDFTQSTGIKPAGFDALMARHGFENQGTVYRRMRVGA